MDVNGKISRFIWRIKNFSKIEEEKLYSETFIVDGIKWRLFIYQKGPGYSTYLSVYLVVADFNALSSDWTRFVQIGIAVIDQNDRKRSTIEVYRNRFKKFNHEFGTSILSLHEFHNRKRGYLVNDACVIEAYISTDKSRGLISSKQIIESVLYGHKIKNHVRVNSKLVGTVTPPSTHPSSQNVEIKSEEPNETNEEEMKAFFASIESEFSCSNLVYSREEAREAVAKLEQALSMTPIGFHDSGKFSPLEREFKILASFDSSSTGTNTLTIEQRDELLSMKKRLKQLADRAAKAVQDKNLLVAKESSKLTVTRNIERSLIRFKEVESEAKEVEEKLVALQEQVEETHKRKKSVLSERKGIFDGCKKMKMELETLGKELTAFEANAKVAEEEEKIVEAEWRTMKDFITSIKGKI